MATMTNNNNNNTGADEDSLLRRLNDEKAQQMVPVIVYMSILMTIGLLGNLMVCYFYGYRTKLTSNTLFILGMAVFDLVTCTITIPLEIYELRNFYMFFNAAACKTMRFVTHFASLASATVLVAIAIDRHRRICRPFAQQYSLRNALRALAVSVGIAVFLAWPVLALYSTVSVVVHSEGNVTVYGSDCTTTRHSSVRVFQWILNGIYFFLFVMAVVILSALYYRVVKVLVKLGRRRSRYSRPITADISPERPDSDGTETSLTIDGNQRSHSDVNREVCTIEPESSVSSDASQSHTQRTQDQIVEHKESQNIYSVKTNKKNQTNGNKEETSVNRGRTNVKTPVADKANSDHIDQKTIKYTSVMIAITVTYVISYLPYLILAIWRLFIQVYEVNVLSDTGLVFFQIGLRSYMLNSAINPFLYGFFNSKFREFFCGLFFPCCNQELVETSTTSC